MGYPPAMRKLVVERVCMDQQALSGWEAVVFRDVLVM